MRTIILLISDLLADDVPPYEVCNTICVVGAGAGDRCDGIGAHGDALCHSRAGGCSTSSGVTLSDGRGEEVGGARLANRDRAAILQSTNSGGKGHVATAITRNQGAARLASASGAESGTDARYDSGCHGRE